MAVRQFRHRRVGTSWDVARVASVCHWCVEPVTVGALVLRWGWLRLPCCLQCARAIHHCEPPAALLEPGVDPKVRQLPEKDR
jgi:hypothetical protein